MALSSQDRGGAAGRPGGGSFAGAELGKVSTYGHGHLPGDSADFLVRLPGSSPPRPGERLVVRADPAFVHLFDPENGRSSR